MFESIYVGMSGLDTYSKGLNVISNNVANLNTVGFKSSQLQFADLYYRNEQGEGQSREQVGAGVSASGTFLNFQQGDSRDTGAELDALIDGSGLFLVRDDGKTFYTRAGQFQIDGEGFLVEKATGARVAGLDDNGRLTDLTIAGKRASAAKASAKVSFKGNLSAGDAQHVATGVTVYDSLGESSAWTVTFDNTNAATAGSWKVTVTDANGSKVGSGELRFTGGRPTIGFDSIAIKKTGSDGQSMTVNLTFSQDVTGFAAGTDSTLAMDSQDGHAAGALVKTTFDTDGNLLLTYSNGEAEKAGKVALALFNSTDSLEQLGGNRFAARYGARPIIGAANRDEFGGLVAGKVESSNVDLSQQFSEMIITQRGYQAASQVVTTTNEMIQQLLEMRGKR
jgi:flagellar hook protein FlgE